MSTIKKILSQLQFFINKTYKINNDYRWYTFKNFPNYKKNQSVAKF